MLARRLSSRRHYFSDVTPYAIYVLLLPFRRCRYASMLSPPFRHCSCAAAFSRVARRARHAFHAMPRLMRHDIYTIYARFDVMLTRHKDSATPPPHYFYIRQLLPTRYACSP